MSGTEHMEFKLLRIIFPHFYIHPDYAEYKQELLVNKKEIAWTVICDFKIENKTSEWYDLSISVTLTLHWKKDKSKISELTTLTAFQAKNGGSFDMNYRFLRLAINQTLGHAQGGWKIKNKNVVINSILPQAYDKAEAVELDLKKKLYEVWE